MKLLIALLLTFVLTGCANMQRQEWKPGQRIGLTWVLSERKGCKEKLVIGQRITYTKCF